MSAGSNGDSDHEYDRVVRSVLLSGALGLAIGAVLAVLTCFLQSLPGRIAPGATFSLRFTLIPLCAVAVGAGLVAAKLAERFAGFCGEILILPITACALVAGLTASQLVPRLMSAPDEASGTLTVFAAAILWLVGSLRVVVERFW